MDRLQEIFNNREIALGCWLIIALFALTFFKPWRDFLRTVFPILFCKKFMVFYTVFSGFLWAVLSMLKWMELWDKSLLKDTVFWVLFVELPLFVKTIEKAKGAHFFYNLIKENIAWSVLIQFVIEFWTFSLPVELLLVPLTLFFSMLYALSMREKKHKPAKKFFDGLLTSWAILLIFKAISSLVKSPTDFFNLITFKSFFLPFVLLVLNFPVVYGLALYNAYEQIFIRLKGQGLEKVKMKVKILCFSGINLGKVTAIRNSIVETILYSLTVEDLQQNLAKLSTRLSLQIGDNYMKRSRYYVIACISGVSVCLIGLVWANAEVPLKDLITFNFVLIMPRIKEIMTWIFSVALVLCIASLIYAYGLNKKQGEDLSQIKKFALFELFAAVKRQESQLVDFPPLDDPAQLYVTYVLNAYDIKAACTKVLSVYENLLKSWERESISTLETRASAFVGNFYSTEVDFSKYNAVDFIEYYNHKVKTAPQNEKINVFLNTTQRDLEKYSEYTKQFCSEFNSYF